MRKIEAQDGLHVCLDMPEGGRAVWSFADSTEPGGGGTAEIETIKRLRPHMRQFVRRGRRWPLPTRSVRRSSSVWPGRSPPRSVPDTIDAIRP